MPLTKNELECYKSLEVKIYDMIDKSKKDIVERLERIFPSMELYTETSLFGKDEEDCYPATTMNWYEFLEKLENGGLSITDKKRKCCDKSMNKYTNLIIY